MAAAGRHAAGVGAMLLLVALCFGQTCETFNGTENRTASMRCGGDARGSESDQGSALCSLCTQLREASPLPLVSRSCGSLRDLPDYIVPLASLSLRSNSFVLSVVSPLSISLIAPGDPVYCAPLIKYPVYLPPGVTQAMLVSNISALSNSYSLIPEPCRTATVKVRLRDS